MLPIFNPCPSYLSQQQQQQHLQSYRHVPPFTAPATPVSTLHGTHIHHHNVHHLSPTFHIPHLSLQHHERQSCIQSNLTTTPNTPSPFIHTYHFSTPRNQHPRQYFQPISLDSHIKRNTNSRRPRTKSRHRTRRTESDKSTYNNLSRNFNCSEPLPKLPLDIWHSVASLLPPTSLATFAKTSKTNADIARIALHNSVLQSLFNSNSQNPNHVEASAITNAVTLLDTCPSLRSKRLAQQLTHICQLNYSRNSSVDITDCFTIDQAIAFLNVDKQKLVKYTPAVTTRRRIRKRRSNHSKGRISSFNAFRPLPPDPNPNSCIKSPLFTLHTVLKAAKDTHGDMKLCLTHVEKTVEEDWKRFERAKLAEENVQKIAKEFGLKPFEIEHILDASKDVMDYRMGLIKKSTNEYSEMITDLLRVYAGLDNIYKFLLLEDGNARLKSKRLVSKALKNMKPFNHSQVTESLQSNLWWAKSPSNKKKMEEMAFGMPQLEL